MTKRPRTPEPGLSRWPNRMPGGRLYMEALQFLASLKNNAQLPGWLKDERASQMIGPILICPMKESTDQARGLSYYPNPHHS